MSSWDDRSTTMPSSLSAIGKLRFFFLALHFRAAWATGTVEDTDFLECKLETYRVSKYTFLSGIVLVSGISFWINIQLGFLTYFVNGMRAGKWGPRRELLTGKQSSVTRRSLKA
jgi:uncharacterized membrane protein